MEGHDYICHGVLSIKNYSLIIETALCGCSIGIKSPDKQLSWKKSQPTVARSFAQIDLWVEEALRDCRLKMSDFENIIVNCGPGSYTGIRMGMSFAQGINAGAEIPLKAACGLSDLLFCEELKTYRSILLPATKDFGFMSYRRSDGFPAVRGLFLKDVATLSSETVTAVIGSWPMAEDMLRKKELPWVTLSPQEALDLALAHLGKDEDLEWKPLYLRSSTAEEQRKGNASHDNAAP